MKFSLSIRKLGEKGQTAVEYILLLAVMTSIITSLLMYVKKHYLGDPQACADRANSTKLLCKINSFLEPSGGAKPFQYFPFKK